MWYRDVAFVTSIISSRVEPNITCGVTCKLEAAVLCDHGKTAKAGISSLNILCEFPWTALPRAGLGSFEAFRVSHGVSGLAVTHNLKCQPRLGLRRLGEPDSEAENASACHARRAGSLCPTGRLRPRLPARGSQF